MLDWWRFHSFPILSRYTFCFYFSEELVAVGMFFFYFLNNTRRTNWTRWEREQKKIRSLCECRLVRVRAVNAKTTSLLLIGWGRRLAGRWRQDDDDVEPSRRIRRTRFSCVRSGEMRWEAPIQSSARDDNDANKGATNGQFLCATRMMRCCRWELLCRAPFPSLLSLTFNKSSSFVYLLFFFSLSRIDDERCILFFPARSFCFFLHNWNIVFI
jgi:hypothetical protein